LLHALPCSLSIELIEAHTLFLMARTGTRRQHVEKVTHSLKT